MKATEAGDDKEKNGKQSAAEKKSDQAKSGDEKKKDEEEKKEEGSGELKVDANEWLNKGWKRNYNNLDVQDKMNMLVDEVFALYLYTVS